MKTITLKIRVQAPDYVEPADVAELVNKFIDIGVRYAIETSENDEIESPDADLATCLEVETPEIV